MSWLALCFVVAVCVIHSTIEDDDTTPFYNYILSTLHPTDSRIFNLRDVAKSLFPNSADITEIQIRRFFHEHDGKIINNEIGSGSSFLQCSNDISSQNGDDITKFFCIKKSNFDLYTTDSYTPETETGKSVSMWFAVSGHDIDNGVFEGTFKITLEIKSPCQIQQKISEEISGPDIKEITERQINQWRIDFSLTNVQIHQEKLLILHSMQIENFPSQLCQGEIYSENLNQVFTATFNITANVKHIAHINKPIKKNNTLYRVRFLNLLTKQLVNLQQNNRVRLYYHTTKDFCEDRKQMDTYLNWLEYVDKMPIEDKQSCVIDTWQEFYRKCVDYGEVFITSSTNQAIYNGDITLQCNTNYVFLQHEYQWFFTHRYSQRNLGVTQDNTIRLSQLFYENVGEYTCHVIITSLFNKSIISLNKFSLTFKDVFSGELTFKFQTLAYVEDYKDKSSPAYMDVKRSTESTVENILSEGVIGAEDPKFDIHTVRNNSGFLQIIGDLYMRKTDKIPYSSWLTSVVKTINESTAEFDHPIDCIQILNDVACVETVREGVMMQHLFVFPTTEVENTSYVSCPNTNGNASLRCEVGAGGHAFWTGFNDSMCKVEIPTLTQRIQVLVEEEITDLNMINKSRELRVYSEEMLKNGSSQDLTLLEKTVRNFVDSLNKSKEVAVDVFDTMDNMMAVKNSIMEESQIENRTAESFLSLLGDITETLTQTEKLAVRKKNYALLGMPVEKSSFRGATYYAGGADEGIIVEEQTSNSSNSSTEFAQVELPSTILENIVEKHVKIVVIGYRNNVLFPEKQKKEKDGGQFEVNTGIISVEVRGQKINKTKQPIEMSFKIKNSTLKTNDKLCSFWNIETGEWSDEGCNFHLYNESTGQHICHCDHLTNFAMLFNGVPPSNAQHRKILSIITYVGLSLSLLGAAITFLVHALFPPLRETVPPKLLMNLCIAVVAMSVVFLCGAENNDFSETECSVIAGFIQYVFLVIFSWSAIEAFHSARALVFPMKIEISNFVLKAMFIGWVVPGIFPLIGGLTMPDDYGEYTEEKSCVVHGNAFYLLQLTPTIAILIANIVALIAIMYSLQTTTSKYSTNTLRMKDRLRIITVFMILFGFTWIFGLLVINNDILIFQYAFCILSTLQGVYIFLFYCVRNPKIRALLWALLKGRYVKDLDMLNSISSSESYSRKRTKTMETTVSNMSINESNRYSLKSTSAIT